MKSTYYLPQKYIIVFNIIYGIKVKFFFFFFRNLFQSTRLYIKGIISVDQQYYAW